MQYTKESKRSQRTLYTILNIGATAVLTTGSYVTTIAANIPNSKSKQNQDIVKVVNIPRRTITGVEVPQGLLPSRLFKHLNDNMSFKSFEAAAIDNYKHLHIHANGQANQMIQLIVSTVNMERISEGLDPVNYTFSRSAQQHSNDMFTHGYISLLNNFAMPPYIRNSLAGGTNAIEESVGSYFNPKGNLGENVLHLLYTMTFRDINHQNYDRKNIFNPFHTSLSVGLRAISSSPYGVVEDLQFKNQFIRWNNQPILNTMDQMILSGNILNRQNICSQIGGIAICYKPLLQNVGYSTKFSTTQAIPSGCVAMTSTTKINPVISSSSLTKIIYNNVSINGNSFFININMAPILAQYGPGEYTMVMWLKQNMKNLQVLKYANLKRDGKNNIPKTNTHGIIPAVMYTIFISPVVTQSTIVALNRADPNLHIPLPQRGSIQRISNSGVTGGGYSVSYPFTFINIPKGQTMQSLFSNGQSSVNLFEQDLAATEKPIITFYK